jgi:hypothetical protein
MTAINAGAAVITVDSNGGGNYRSIQEALNHAQNGDTITVNSGIYKEGSSEENVIVYSSFTIVSYSSTSYSSTSYSSTSYSSHPVDWVNLISILNALHIGYIFDTDSGYVKIYDRFSLSPSEREYLKSQGYSPVVQMEWERKPDLKEYNSNQAYQKWYDAGEIVGIPDPVVIGYIWQKPIS